MRQVISVYSVNFPPGDEPDDYNKPPKIVPANPLAPFAPLTQPSKGWECPKCGRCYAPWVPDCEVCGKEKSVQQDGREAKEK